MAIFIEFGVHEQGTLQSRECLVEITHILLLLKDTDPTDAIVSADASGIMSGRWEFW